MRISDVELLGCGTSFPTRFYLPRIQVQGCLDAPPFEIISTAGACFPASTPKYGMLSIAGGILPTRCAASELVRRCFCRAITRMNWPASAG